MATYTSGSVAYTEGQWLTWSGLNTVLLPNTTYAYTFANAGNGYNCMANAGNQPYANGQAVCITTGGAVTNGNSSPLFNGTFDIGLIPEGIPPYFTTVPASASVRQGATNTLTAAFASSVSGTLTYQWYWDSGTPGVYSPLANGIGANGVTLVTGATTTSLVISNFQAAYAADYEVVATDSNGSVVNDGLNGDPAVATLTMNSSLPAITTAPVNWSWNTNYPAKSTVAATGAFTYQWQSDYGQTGTYTNLLNGGLFSGVNTPTLTITNFTASTVADYQCVIANGAGSVTTTPVTLSVQTSNLLANAQFWFPGTAKIQTGFATVPGWTNAAVGTGYTDTGVQGATAGITDPFFNSAWEGYTDAQQGGAYQATYYPIKYGDSFTLTWWAHYESETVVPWQFSA